MEIDGSSVIVKVKKQITHWSETPEATQISEEISRAIENLKLTEGCKSTPKLLGCSIQRQGPSHSVPGGYVAFIVMSRVPGVDLSNYPDMEKEEQHRVQVALLDALWEFHKYRLWHWDQRLPNIIWNSKNNECYIVDLEDVEHFPDRKPGNVSLNPWEQLSLWGLIGCEIYPVEWFYCKEDLIAYWMDHLAKD